MDSYTDGTLKKGQTVVGASPGQSEYYTTMEAFDSMAGSAESYYSGLQISPNTSNPNFPMYRSGVTVYEVSEDTPAAFGQARANPQLGDGGQDQIFVPNYKNVLVPKYSIPFKGTK